MPRLLPALLLSIALPALLGAEPLARRAKVDFFSDVRSRDLSGLASRSDGRLVAGPVLTELAGSVGEDLLWALEPGADGRWLVGTGPDGRILEAAVDAARGSFTTREVAHLDDPHVFALKRLPDGSILAGTSPRGGLVLVRDGKVVARTGLASDSIFDLLLAEPGVALAAAGNPGRIYRIDLARFAAAGVSAARTEGGPGLAARGITVFGEIRDRNVRRIARLDDGRIAAGSAPRGNVYVFPAAGGAPFLLQEDHECEVTDLLGDGAGGFYAAIIHSASEARLSPTAPKPASAQSVSSSPPETGASPHVELFGGRSTVVWFPRDGYPATLVDQAELAVYRLARWSNLLLMAGGDQGELAGYDLDRRMTLRLSGSTSGQLNGLAALPDAGPRGGRYLVLRNNPAGLALLDWTDARARSVQTRPIDLGAPARLGALRLDWVRGIPADSLTVLVSTGNASDESEGWSPWLPMREDPDGGWRAAPPLGRYVRLRLGAAAPASPSLEIDRASVFYLPQDHRPRLDDFRLLPPNFAVMPPSPASPQARTTVGQLIDGEEKDGEGRASVGLSTSAFASPGTRVAYWTVSDADGDNLAYTFSIRRDGDSAWTDLAVDSPNPFIQFDTAHLPEGAYFIRLVASETAPRPAAERLSVAYETDEMVVDHTPPAILAAEARRDGAAVRVSVHGRAPRALLQGLEAVFNNGIQRSVEQPADGIPDGRDKTFVIEVPAAQAAGATSVEVTLWDEAGNAASQRVPIGP